MYKISWRRRLVSFQVITGIKHYPNHLDAQRQVSIWQQLFPFNTYYIFPGK